MKARKLISTPPFNPTDYTCVTHGAYQLWYTPTTDEQQILLVYASLFENRINPNFKGDIFITLPEKHSDERTLSRVRFTQHLITTTQFTDPILKKRAETKAKWLEHYLKLIDFYYSLPNFTLFPQLEKIRLKFAILTAAKRMGCSFDETELDDVENQMRRAANEATIDAVLRQQKINEAKQAASTYKESKILPMIPDKLKTNPDINDLVIHVERAYYGKMLAEFNLVANQAIYSREFDEARQQLSDCIEALQPRPTLRLPPPLTLPPLARSTQSNRSYAFFSSETKHSGEGTPVFKKAQRR